MANQTTTRNMVQVVPSEFEKLEWAQKQASKPCLLCGRAIGFDRSFIAQPRGLITVSCYSMAIVGVEKSIAHISSIRESIKLFSN